MLPDADLSEAAHNSFGGRGLNADGLFRLVLKCLRIPGVIGDVGDIRIVDECFVNR